MTSPRPAIPPPPPPQFPKRCACSRTYDESAWRGLRRIGTMADGLGGWLELRDCDCGSTIAIERVAS